ncbi:MAG: fumarate hydratase [Patescibacteria group bacterium]
MKRKRITVRQIVCNIKRLCNDANYYLPHDVAGLLGKACEQEVSPQGKEILKNILDNADIALGGRFPLCQDCGTAVVFVELGQNVSIKGGNLIDAINQGVAKGYKEGCLRKSICHPLTRKNTGDNTPAVIHIDIVHGNNLKMVVMPKGGGAENMAKLTMLKPSDGKESIANFVVKSVSDAGSNPCPPIIVGVGIGGGTAERAMFLAKRALLRTTVNSDKEIAEFEKELLEKVNALGIGSQGFGGSVTALVVYVEMEPCDIASLPVAVNLQCHSARYAEAVL